MPSLPKVTWYFDVVSPYAYFQCLRLPEVERVAAVRRVPVLFAGLLDRWGQLGPAEIVPKRRFTFRYAVWHAARAGVPFRLPPAHPFNPLRLLRLAVALDARADAVERIFGFVWAEGRSADDPAQWQSLCRSLGVEDGDALVGRPEVKEGLRANGEEAIARDVFGVPTFVTEDGEIFWGEDATPMLLDHLAGHPVMTGDEMRRADRLPAAAARRVTPRGG